MRKQEGLEIQMNRVSLPKVNQFVLQKQHLQSKSKIDDVFQVCEDISGLHATSPMTPYLSLFARGDFFSRQNLEAELFEKKRLGRIRCMRGTIHVLTKEMIPIAYAATKRIMLRDSEGFLRFRGVSTQKYVEISSSILGILKGREMSTYEIKDELKTEANVSAIVEQMCEEGLVIRGRPRKGWKDRMNRYSVFNDVFPDLDLSKIDEREARTSLVLRYIRSYGPATENDIAWWIGISKKETRDALNNLQAQLQTVEITDLSGEYILMKSDLERIRNSRVLHGQSVNLLPCLDPYLMGYKDRERYLSAEDRDNVFDPSGNATSTILVNGKVAGVWDLEENKRRILKFHLFDRVENSTFKQVQCEAKRIGMFMADNEVEPSECYSMTPLSRRNAGWFMKPLSNL